MSAQLQTISGILFLLFGGLAFFDGVYLHLWRFRLFAWRESRREHALHTVRAILYPLTIYLMLAIEARGFWLYVGVFVALIDLIFQGWDLFEERKARRGFGGLSAFEYALHVWLTGIHMAALTAAICARSVADWTLHASITSTNPALSPLGIEIAWFLLPGAIVVAILHAALLHPFFVKGDAPPASMFRSREPGLMPLF